MNLFIPRDAVEGRLSRGAGSRPAIHDEQCVGRALYAQADRSGVKQS
jgi:hypothetical protein